MPKRALALILVVAAIAFGVWRAFDASEVAPRPESGASPAPAPSPVEVHRTDPPATTADTVREALTRGPDRILEYEFRIRVVHDDDGTPRAGVELRTSPSTALLQERRDDYALHPGEDFEGMLARAGALVRSDAQGEARIAHDGPDLHVLACDRDSFASQRLHIDGPMRASDFTIRLERDRTLVFLMLDEHDAPVEGVQLTMTGIPAEADRATTPRRRSERSADHEGRIVIRHAQKLRRDDGLAATECEVVANLAGLEGEPVRVTLDPLPEEPVAVRVPPWSALEVAVLGPDGEPWSFPEARKGTLTVMAVLDGPLRAPIFGKLWDISPDGIARVGPLRAGQRYALSLFELRIPPLAVRAPERPGELLRVELRVPRSAPIVSGRILDEAGVARAGACLLGFAGKASSGELEIACGSDGRFRTVLPSELVADTVELGVRSLPGGISAPVPSTTALSVRTLVAGDNELGELRLAPMHVLAEGRVEWEDGQPVVNAGVGVETGRGGGKWSSSRTERATTDRDGAFRIMGLADGRARRLTVGHMEALAAEPSALVPRAHELVLRLQRGASVEATFLADPELPLRELGFTLRWTGSGNDPRRDANDWCDREATRVRWTRLPAGRYSLVIRTSGTNSPITSIDDLAVAPGKPCEDARLRDIDLRGRVQRCELRVVDADGRPLVDRSLRAEWLDGGGRWRSIGSQLHSGAIEFALVQACDVMVSADGHRRAVVRATPGVVELQLVRAASLRLQCAAEVPGEVEFWVRLRPVETAASSDARPATEVTLLSFTARREVIWSPAEDRVVDVEVILRRGANTRYVTVLSPSRLDNTTLDPALPIELRLDQRSLAAALAELKD